MSRAIKSESNSELSTTLVPSEEATIELAAPLADARMQSIRDYQDREKLGKAKSKAQDRIFREIAAKLARPNRGWSPISDRELKSKTREERLRARKARNKQDQRARAAESATRAAAVVIHAITREQFADRLAGLQRWLALPDHRSRNLRRRSADIMRAWVVRRDYVGLHGREPTLAAFADTFAARFKQPMTRQMAQRRLALLAVLEATGGPFAPAF